MNKKMRLKHPWYCDPVCRMWTPRAASRSGSATFLWRRGWTSSLTSMKTWSLSRRTNCQTMKLCWRSPQWTRTSPTSSRMSPPGNATSWAGAGSVVWWGKAKTACWPRGKLCVNSIVGTYIFTFYRLPIYLLYSYLSSANYIKGGTQA